MQRPEEFREDLNTLMMLAAANDFCLTREQVEENFKEYGLSPEQMETIYQYLIKNGTTVEDRDQSEKAGQKDDGSRKDAGRESAPEREEDSAYYRMYLADLAALPPHSPAREAVLLERCLAGEEEAARELIEGRLRFAAQTAALYRGKGLPLMDLIQEANMALVLAVGELTGGAISRPAEELFLEAIEDALEAALAEAGAAAEVGEHLASQVNTLMIVTARLAEELGREATLAELSERMHMPEDHVRELVKMAMDAMTVQEDEPISPELS